MDERDRVANIVYREANRDKAFRRDITKLVMNLSDEDSVLMIAESYFNDIGSIFDLIDHMPRFARDTYLIKTVSDMEEWENMIERTVEAQEVFSKF